MLLDAAKVLATKARLKTPGEAKKQRCVFWKEPGATKGLLSSVCMSQDVARGPALGVYGRYAKSCLASVLQDSSANSIILHTEASRLTSYWLT